MKKIILVLTFFGFCVYLSGISFAAFEKIHRALSKVEGLKQQGSLRQETAYRIAQPRVFSKIKNQLILSEIAKLSEKLNFKITGRFYYDAVYDAAHNFPKNVGSDQKYELELRDTYFDYSDGPFDVRLGKQQIVWGEAVGLFFADVVNAKDLREFILPDFDLIRIPQWGIDAEYSKKNFHAEFLWLPILEFNKIGVRGAEFEFPYPVPEGVSFATQDPREPKNNFKNSETGMRLSYLLSGLDISAFYLYSWEKFPIRYRSISAGVYNFTPQYKRLNITGLTFSKEISKIVCKGEFVFTPNGYFSLFDDTDSDGITRKDFLDYLVGIDFSLFKKIDNNIQFMQRVIFDYDKHLVNENPVRNSISYRISRGFLNDTLDAEFLVIASLMEKDFLYRPKATYNFKNNWKVRVGMDIFKGEPSGVFGKFKKKSRIYSEATYSF